MGAAGVPLIKTVVAAEFEKLGATDITQKDLEIGGLPGLETSYKLSSSSAGTKAILTCYGGGGAEVGVPGSRFACRSVLLVEQNARSGLAAAHVGAVLESGVVRLVRPAGELLADPDVARL